MRILCYNHAPEISGAERSLLSIMGHAQAAGYWIRLCAPRGALADKATLQGIRTMVVAPLVLGHTRNPLVLGRYLAGATWPILGLARAVRHTRPDVVHANSLRAGVIAGMALQLVWPRPKLVVHVRDALGAGLLDRVVAAALGWEADAIVAISRYAAGGLRGHGAPTYVLHNAIDPAQYQRDATAGEAVRRDLGVPPCAPLLAVIGQLTPWKGQMDALDAFGLLRRSVPEAHLVVVGAAKFVGKHRRYDTAAYREALVARAGQADLQGHVHFTGDVGDVAAVYSAATLQVVPSWAEPFGRVVVEAMAAGCPVVATCAGGIPEIISHGVDGWLAPPRDPAALAQAMRQLLGDGTLRHALAAAGYITATERFSLSRYMPALEDIWGAVARAGRSAS